MYAFDAQDLHFIHFLVETLICSLMKIYAFSTAYIENSAYYFDDAVRAER